MGYKVMKPAQVQDGGEKGRAFEETSELAAAGNGDWILVPDDIRQLVITVVPTTATAKVQTTTDPIAVVKSGTGITAVDWDAGAVSSTTQDVAYPVTALRLVQIGAGTAKMSVRAQ